MKSLGRQLWLYARNSVPTTYTTWYACASHVMNPIPTQARTRADSHAGSLASKVASRPRPALDDACGRDSRLFSAKGPFSRLRRLESAARNCETGKTTILSATHYPRKWASVRRRQRKRRRRGNLTNIQPQATNRPTNHPTNQPTNQPDSQTHHPPNPPTVQPTYK